MFFFFVHIGGVACCVVVEVMVRVVVICKQIYTQPSQFGVVDVIGGIGEGDWGYCGWGDCCRYGDLFVLWL